MFACLDIFYYSVIYTKEEAEKQKEKDYYLPALIKSCQSYPALVYFDNVFNKILPDSVTENMKNIGETTMEKIRIEEMQKRKKAKQDEEK